MTLDPGLAAVAVAQGGPFTTAQARAAGYNSREIDRLLKPQLWTRLRRGVYVETALVPTDVAGRHLLQLRAALLCLDGDVVASHSTAAMLHGIALLDGDRSLVHVTRSAPSRTEAGVRHHKAALPASQLTKIDGLLATTAGRTVVDLAREASFEVGLVAAESALNRQLTALADLREIMAYCIDWPGARNAGRVVSFASPYSESPGESLSRIAFDAAGLPAPAQQVSIFDHRGFVARTDFLWAEHKTIAEFDGRLKYYGATATKETLYEEKKREDRLREAGFEVFRIDWIEACSRSPEIRRKALAAFDRASRSAAALRCRLVPPQAAA